MLLETADISRHPPRTLFRGVRSAHAPARSWLDSLPSSATLAAQHILHAGIAFAPPGYQIVRSRQSTSFFMATFSGEGRVLADGQWQRLCAGQGCLLPAGILNAFETTGTEPWEFCWVCREHTFARAMTGAPTLGPYNPEPLRHAIMGLEAEAAGGGASAMHYHWSELIHLLEKRFAALTEVDASFSALWESVAATLAGPWSLETLAQTAGCSREKLRQLCSRYLGRSPMQHLSHLRLEKAARLLMESDSKLETIAGEVSFANGFILSKAFLKWSGVRPSEFRQTKSANQT